MTDTCLLIDDSRLARRICRALLEGQGFIVTEANDGAQGLALVQARHFALILVDQFMPVMTGLEFFCAFQGVRESNDTRILVCSSDATPTLIAQARALGADGYLNKPYTAGALARQLKCLQFDVK